MESPSPSRISSLSLALLCSALVGEAVAAPGATPDKSMRALRVDRAPDLDGKLDDRAWTTAAFVSDFLQKQPTFGHPPTRRTEVAVLYDDQALYVGARMYIKGRDDVQAVLTRRDVTGSAERIIISFDTFRDRRTAFSFAVTAAGVRADWYHPDDSEFSRDSSFNPVWNAAVAMQSDRWTAEMRIPFTQLRFPRGSEQTWGVNINRYIPQRNEDLFWIPVPKEETAWSSYFGRLTGLSGLRNPARVEFLPYVTADATLLSATVAADRGQDEIGGTFRAGGDLTMGVGSNMTLNLTVLPDFGQVEADPAQVNLSGFEFFFNERRPFFTAGSQLIEGDGSNFYYSRRIGAPPRGCVGVYLDCPNSTAILGAAKLTGRLPSGVSVGGLAALTGSARAIDMDSGESVRLLPPTGYATMRVQREFGADASIVGGSLTGMARALGDDDPLLDSLVRHSIAGGIDWRLRFDSAIYQLKGNLGFSHIGARPGVIDEIARNTVHAFQRPDQSHVSLDPDATSMFGMNGNVAVEKRQGDWRWEVASTFETPGFEPNQVGRLQSADDIALYATLGYGDRRRGRYLHRWVVSLGSANEWNFSGARDPGWYFLNADIETRNFWNLNTQLSVFSPGLDDAATRGGPLMGVGWGGQVRFRVSSPFALKNRWNALLALDRREIGMSGAYFQTSLTWQPSERLSIILAPSYWRPTDNRQYVDTIDIDPDTDQPIDPPNYIFGTLARQEVSLQTRIQLGISANLTIDGYVESFASSGRYLSFGALAASGNRALTSLYTVEDDDFTVLSLRSTAVLRWEFIPGSILFLVWQQNRSDRANSVDSIWSGLGRSFAAPGGTTLAVKLSYWFTADQARSLWRH